MRIRKLIFAFGILALAPACTTPLPDVRGFQAPGGARVVGELRASSTLTQGMPEGSASYIGASADGSLIGFITADGFVRWYRTH